MFLIGNLACMDDSGILYDILGVLVKHKHEVYNREYLINIQAVIKNIIASFEINISAISR